LLRRKKKISSNNLIKESFIYVENNNRGGWWFRDPVENASFMPWVIATRIKVMLINFIEHST